MPVPAAASDTHTAGHLPVADASMHVPATVFGTEAITHLSIAGYRDDSLETVKRNEQQYQIPLEVVSYKQLYGWTMDEIVKEIGTKNNCTFCGVFRRQALDRGATMMKVHTSAPVAALTIQTFSTLVVQ